MKGARHKAREVALQVLYEIDAVGHQPDEAIQHILSRIEVSDRCCRFCLMNW